MTLETEWTVLLTMAASGLLLGVFLDLYRVLKGQWELTGWVVAIVDLCYWIVAAGWVFSVLIWSTWGELRFYMLLFLFIGAGVYYLWLSRPMITVLLFAIRVVQASIRTVSALLRMIVWTPLLYVWFGCKAVAHAVYRLALILLRAVGWLLKPVHAWAEPVTAPVCEWLLKLSRFVGGYWHQLKKRRRK